MALFEKDTIYTVYTVADSRDGMMHYFCAYTWLLCLSCTVPLQHVFETVLL